MLINSKKILKDARESGYAIGGFNTSDLEITQAILEAANEINSPVIVQTSEKAIDFAGLDNLVSIIKNEAEKYKIPIVLHLDHGRSVDIVKKCLEAGYTSVMFDGSRLSFEENIRQTQEVVRLAKQFDAQVEGEVGCVSGSEDYVHSNEFKSDPEQVKQFVEETGIDSVAVAFGNAHGVPDPNEKLDFELLEKISKMIKIPLVFHGASSTPVADMKKAISLGIAKVNIDTDIRLAFSGAIKDFQDKHPDVYDPREIMGSAKEAVRKVVESKIKLFSMK